MKILTIRILQPQFQNIDSELYKKCKKLLDNEDISQEKFDKYMSYCIDLKNIRDAENPVNEWVLFIKQFLMKIFKDGIYNEEDSTFSFGKEEKTLMKLIENICELDIYKEFIDAFSTSFGDIHEAFRVYNSGKGSKELGQFFTPRPLIHTILHGCGLNDIIKSYENPSIYDCCMGTGGLLARAYSNGNITPNNIYGCETEKDTIKFGQCSLLITTNEFNSNIIKCNSLCENPFIGTKKFDIIFTNPPFGTSMNYKEIEKKFNENKNNLGNEVNVNFKDVYPIVVNNGACLFTQHCIYMLEENGTCAIVLPDGELFTGNKFKKFREYMCEKVNIIKIINVSGKAFEHTAIKTAVIIFQKNGSTKNIEFLDIPDDCNSVKRLMVIPINNIKNNNYNLSYNAYVNKEERQYNDGIVVKTLGEVCEFQNGYSFKSTDYEKQNETNIGILQIKSIQNGFIDENKITEYIPESSKYKLFEINKGDILIGLTGTFKIGLYNLDKKSYLNQRVGKITAKTGIIQKYIYYWYLCCDIESEILKMAKGTAQANISTNDISNIKIPIPSLERQQEIVEECEQITKSIDTIKLRKEQLKSDGILFKKYYKKNELNEIYKNSEVKELGDVFKEVKTGKDVVATERKKGEYPFYGANGIIDYVDSYIFDGKYLLTARTGSLGSLHISNGKFWCSGDVHRMEFENDTLLSYTYYYLQTIDFQKFRTGSAHPKLSGSSLKSIKIPIPSLENQEKIVAYYEQMTDEYKKHILDKIEEHNKELEMLKELCVNMFSL
jgi:type I restriction enzyme S subunit